MTATDDEVLTTLARIYTAVQLLLDEDGDGGLYAVQPDGSEHPITDLVLNELVRRDWVEVRELGNGELSIDLSGSGRYWADRRERAEAKANKRRRA